MRSRPIIRRHRNTFAVHDSQGMPRGSFRFYDDAYAFAVWIYVTD